jgi:spore coat polysaccharide biosynthesis predicted glycosyltransferase SpsG
LKRREHPEIKKILVSMGGVDQSNATSRVLDALKNCSMPLSVQITIVMGAQAPYLNKVRDMALTMPWETEVLENISNMAQVMADNDLAIGAAGSTSWERCCVGLPTLLIVLAENQRTGALALQKQGAAIVIGEPAASQGEIPPAISTLMSGKLLSEMISAASVVTDGLGTLRVVNSMGIQS